MRWGHEGVKKLTKKYICCIYAYTYNTRTYTQRVIPRLVAVAIAVISTRITIQHMKNIFALVTVIAQLARHRN